MADQFSVECPFCKKATVPLAEPTEVVELDEKHKAIVPVRPDGGGIDLVGECPKCEKKLELLADRPEEA